MRRHYRTIVFDSARWDGFALRDGDIFITTPPKCGTTWTQMICALLVFQAPSLPRKLDLLSPWLDMLTRDIGSVTAELRAQTHRRFIKTHTPLDGLPWDERVTYLCVGRDPRDVFLSWDNHLANFDAAAFIAARERAVGLEDAMEELAKGLPERAEHLVDRFWEWVDDDRPVTETFSLHATLHHLETFWAVRERPNVVMVHYADLQRDLEAEMRRIARRLGIEVAEDRWPELVRAATFEEMRGRADELAPGSTTGIWQDNRRFFNRGTNGQWRDLLGEAELTRYFERVGELAPPELAAWAHRG
jgi:hypothetical protein